MNQVLGVNKSKLDDGSVFVNQCAYVKEILSRFHMDWANSESTPRDKSFVPDVTENKLIGKEVPYC